MPSAGTASALQLQLLLSISIGIVYRALCTTVRSQTWSSADWLAARCARKLEMKITFFLSFFSLLLALPDLISLSLSFATLGLLFFSCPVNRARVSQHSPATAAWEPPPSELLSIGHFVPSLLSIRTFIEVLARTHSARREEASMRSKFPAAARPALASDALRWAADLSPLKDAPCFRYT